MTDDQSNDPFKGKLAVVTGASRGIGRALALALAARGTHVMAVARTVGALEELDDEIRAAGGSATLVPLNVTDYDGLDRLGGAINERWGKLDMLVGNAGVLGPLSPLGHVEPKAFEEVLAVNVTANWRLIRSLDPLLRLSNAGRAVFITSAAARKCTAYWGPYSTSKAALEALVRTYAAETRNISPVRVMLLNPGPLRTAMRHSAMPGEDPATLKTPEDFVPDVLRFLAPASQDTGQLYDFQTDTVIRFPAA
jgi:NAD(P)-dependent dehydrogenase (short-subunit alcohol dehydrogenase family)